MATTQVSPYANEINQNAGMAKLVDALDLGSCGATRKSSTLFTRTTLRPVGFGWQAPIKKYLICRKKTIEYDTQ